MGGAAEVTVRGMVQGVGFRPFVYRLASELDLTGNVRNDGGAVVIRVSGSDAALADFLVRLREQAPEHARIEHVSARPVDGVGLGSAFVVVGSTGGAAGPRAVPPDLATCAACVRELFDPADRRYQYPFLNCTDCGPRATIVDKLPYDRVRTAMRVFPLCEDCAAEYQDPADRRFHAEPIACPACGPRLRWLPPGKVGPAVFAEDALAAAVGAIDCGGIVAVKGLGGYQLVCDAADEAAVARLRIVKGRPSKAFAVMVPGIAEVRELVRCDVVAERLMTSSAAPIVLLPRRAGSAVSRLVAPGLAELGVFLPSTPLHHLLFAALARPLVVTSGNRGGEPIVIEDRRAGEVLGPVCEGVLGHDRPIWTRYDDSVARVVHGRPSLIRRARGYAPEPLALPVRATRPVIALGAQLKHTVTVACGDRAMIGPHVGNLEDAETFDAFQGVVERLCRLQGVDPDVCAHDLHPGYLSTAFARRWAPECRIGVQHHHAHVVATAAEHGLAGPFVGLAFDGLGMGADGTFWGGEVLVADYRDFRRVGRFGTAPMPGGAAAVRRPARMALGYLFGAEECGDDQLDGSLARNFLARLEGREIDTVRAMVGRGLNSPRASSVGRLFDAVAALLGLCDDNSYEGEAAILLEATARQHPDGEPLPIKLTTVDGLSVYDPVPTLRALLESRDDPGVLAARFHSTVADVAVALAERACAEAGLDTVCLGGGVFQNRRLTEGVLCRLSAAGLHGFVGERVPVNDAGISYGQAAVAAARMSEE